MFGFIWSGIASIKSAIRRTTAFMSSRTTPAIAAVVEYIYDESQRLVPVDTGELKESGYRRLTGTGFATVGDVGYTAAHAGIVHEDLTTAHAFPTQAKYLEQPIREKKAELASVAIVAAKSGTVSAQLRM